MRTNLLQVGALEADSETEWRPWAWTDFEWRVASLLSKSYVFTNESFSFFG